LVLEPVLPCNSSKILAYVRSIVGLSSQLDLIFD
jgi:hypothetical protein